VTRLSRFSTRASSRPLGRITGAMFAIALLVESGCLIPQSIDQLDPDAGQHPAPHIVIEQIPEDMLAPKLTLYRQGPLDAAESPGCHCNMPLTLNLVEEADPSITLQARWFIDYDPDKLSTQASPQETDIRGDFNGSVFRSIPILIFDADQLGILNSGLHIVEVVIADKEGFDDSQEARFPHRSVKPGYESAVYRLAIQLDYEQNPATPQCLATPPVVRTGCAQ